MAAIASADHRFGLGRRFNDLAVTRPSAVHSLYVFDVRL